MFILTSLVVGSIATSLWLKARASKTINPKDPIDHETESLHLADKPQTNISSTEAEAKKQQYIALSTVGLFSLAHLSFPVIAVAAFPLLAYNYVHQIKALKERSLKRGNISILLFDFVSISLTIFTGLYFLASVLFTAFFTAQRLIAQTEREAHEDFNRIFGELSPTTWLLKEGIEIEVLLESLKPQDIIVIRAGEMIPVDGHIFSGEGLLDQHLLTGEFQPVEKQKGDEVFSSTLLISGVLQISVEKQGADTLTGQIAKTLEHAATLKHQVQSRGDAIVEKGALRTFVACAITLPFFGLSRAAALSYSGFGYQMRAAAPMMVLNYLRIASNKGILIKDGRALDKLSAIDTIVFDKTGTLTEEIPSIEHLIACDGFTEVELLQYAASIEQHQKHPIAQAICQTAKQQGIDLLEQIDSEYMIGHGLRAQLRDPNQSDVAQIVFIGSRNFIDQQMINIPESINKRQQEAGEKGHSIVYIASDAGQLIGAIEMRPTLRPQAEDTIKALHDLGMTLYIISGDQKEPTAYLAEQLGIDHYFAETLPQEKALHIKNLQAKGHSVCFIGDGINDSVALQQSDVSISLEGAATIAQDTADIVLMTPDLLHLPYLVTLSKELHQQMGRCELMNNAFGTSCVAGIFLFGMGLEGAVLLYSVGLLVNVSSAMLPLLKHSKMVTTQPP